MDGQNHIFPSRHFFLILAACIVAVGLFFLGRALLTRTSEASDPTLRAGTFSPNDETLSGDTISFADAFLSEQQDLSPWKNPRGEDQLSENERRSLKEDIIGFLYPAYKKDLPYIESITPERFNNGDMITIHGRNFSFNNTVLLSIDFDDKYVNIPSFDGTTISFRVNLSVTEKLKQDFAHLNNEDRKMAIAHIVDVKSKQTGESGEWHMPAQIAISNENGMSSPFQTYINILAGI